MQRPILSLWPFAWRATLPITLLTALTFATGHWEPLPAVGFLVFLYLWRGRWFWRFARQVRHFHTVTSDRIVLHYASELDCRWYMPVLLKRCEAELDDLASWFGFRLRGRPVVYLFASDGDVSTIRGLRCGGFAIPLVNTIVVANGHDLWGVMRHEYAHLFAARWNICAPPLLKEGLPVCLQSTKVKRLFERALLTHFDKRALKITSLLKPGFFYSGKRYPSYGCYVLAGSFTRFLLRRYGREKYRTLFRRANGFRFRAKFKKCFGDSLEEAERQWRAHISESPQPPRPAA